MTRKPLPFGIGNLRYLNWFTLASMVALMAIGVCYIYSANAFRASQRLQYLFIDQRAFRCSASSAASPSRWPTTGPC